VNDKLQEVTQAMQQTIREALVGLVGQPLTAEALEKAKVELSEAMKQILPRATVSGIQVDGNNRVHAVICLPEWMTCGQSKLNKSDETKICTIKFDYFKASGKFYTSGQIGWRVPMCDDGRTPYMDEVVQRVRRMQHAGKPLPGIVSPWTDGYVYVTCDDGFPCLLQPLTAQAAMPSHVVPDDLIESLEQCRAVLGLVLDCYGSSMQLGDWLARKLVLAHAQEVLEKYGRLDDGGPAN
jgi:hypothetical protein